MLVIVRTRYLARFFADLLPLRVLEFRKVHVVCSVWEIEVLMCSNLICGIWEEGNEDTFPG